MFVIVMIPLIDDAVFSFSVFGAHVPSTHVLTAAMRAVSPVEAVAACVTPEAATVVENDSEIGVPEKVIVVAGSVHPVGSFCDGRLVVASVVSAITLIFYTA